MRGRRIAALVAALALHVMLIGLLLTKRGGSAPTEANQQATEVYFLDLASDDEVPESAVGPQRSTLARRPPTPLEERPPRVPSTALPGIDWAGQAERIARDRISREEGPPEGRQLDGRRSHRDSASVASQPNIWSHARTHRVEPIASGGLVINLTDRCSVVVIGVPMVGCGLGKMPARGDLFESLDTVSLGDWKDQ